MDIDLEVFFESELVGESGEYKDLQIDFESRGTTVLRQVLLRRISEYAPIKGYKIDEKIQKIASFLLLNPIELAYWEMLLHQTSQTERNAPVALLYIFTAFLTKSTLNDSVAVFESELAQYISGFKLSFDNWMLITSCPITPSLYYLNQRFTKILSQHQHHRDYEDMINGLMPLPRRKDSLNSDRSDDSTLCNFNQARKDFYVYMGDDKLSPIDQEIELE